MKNISKFLVTACFLASTQGCASPAINSDSNIAEPQNEIIKNRLGADFKFFKFKSVTAKNPNEYPRKFTALFESCRINEIATVNTNKKTVRTFTKDCEDISINHSEMFKLYLESSIALKYYPYVMFFENVVKAIEQANEQMSNFDEYKRLQEKSRLFVPK